MYIHAQNHQPDQYGSTESIVNERNHAVKLLVQILQTSKLHRADLLVCAEKIVNLLTKKHHLPGKKERKKKPLFSPSLSLERENVKLTR